MTGGYSPKGSETWLKEEDAVPLLAALFALFANTLVKVAEEIPGRTDTAPGITLGRI